MFDNGINPKDLQQIKYVAKLLYNKLGGTTINDWYGHSWEILCKAKDVYNPKRGKPITLISKIVYYECINQYRLNKYKKHVTDKFDIEYNNNQLERLIDLETKSAKLRLIDDNCSDMSELMYCYFNTNITMRVLSEIFNVPIGSIKSSSHYERKKLKVKLNEYIKRTEK